MRIGLNLLFLLPGISGGTETYAKGLMTGLSRCGVEHEYFVYLNQYAADLWLPETENFKRIICPIDGRRRLSRYAYEQLILPRRVRKDEVEVLHSLGYVGPLSLSCSSVVTIHDLNFKAFGAMMSPIRRRVRSLFTLQTARHGDRIIVPSKFSRDELIDGIPEVAAKVNVIWEAVVQRPTRSKDRLVSIPAGKYVIAFNNASLHKNIPRLVEAFERARKREGFPHLLVLVGTSPIGLRTSPAIICLPRQSESDLNALLRGAEALVVPSIYEGFGLPVLEAMSEGIPVACSSAGSLPEVAGEAALLFDPLSVEKIEQAIIDVITEQDLRRRLVALGKENVKRFSWEKAAEETLEVYRSASSGKRSRTRSNEIGQAPVMSQTEKMQ